MLGHVCSEVQLGVERDMYVISVCDDRFELKEDVGARGQALTR